jgi:hypothetical protein
VLIGADWLNDCGFRRHRSRRLDIYRCSEGPLRGAEDQLFTHDSANPKMVKCGHRDSDVAQNIVPTGALNIMPPSGFVPFVFATIDRRNFYALLQAGRHKSIEGETAGSLS